VPKRTRRLGGARIDGDLVDCGREGASALINGGRVEKRVVATVRRGGRDLPPTSEIVAERLQAAKGGQSKSQNRYPLAAMLTLR
jgi:hypothetical protein